MCLGNHIVDAALAQGKPITGMMTSRKNITKMRSNAVIQKAINGNVGAGALVRRTALDAYLEEEFGITTIITNDLTYGANAVIGGIISDKKIKYKNAQYSLSGFCKEFMPNRSASGAYQGPKYFSFNGKILDDIRKERKLAK